MGSDLETRTDTKSVYLTPEEERNERDFFDQLTRSIVFLGDPDYRRITEADAGSVTAIIDRVTQAAGLEEEEDRESVLTQSLHDGFMQLEDIIGGGTGHTLLGKVLGVIAYCDLATEYNAWPSNFGDFFNEVLQTESAYGDRIILTAALYARLAYHWVDKFGPEYLEELDGKMIGLVDSRDAAINKLRIHVAARVLSDMLSENELRMRLPWTTVVSNETVDYPSFSREGGFPETTMHLHEGFYPSHRKLQEAVKYGMPEVRGALIVRRMPRLLAGVHVKDVSGLHNTHRERLKTEQSRRFIYMYLRGLRRMQSYGDDGTGEDCTYDTLSLIGAIRVARELRDEQSITMSEVDALIGDFTEKLTTTVIETEGDELSIISIALAESQQIDGVEGWGRAEAIGEMKRNIKYLLVRLQGIGFSVRGEDDILAMYRRHIWQVELTHEDKFELACALLSDPECPCWQEIPEADQPELAQAIHNGKKLDRQFEELVIENCRLEDKIDIRCETIRNTFEPETLREGKKKI